MTGAHRDSLQKAVQALETKRKSRIFCFIEGSDEHLCTASMSHVFTRRQEFKNIDTLEILVHSGGGHSSLAYRIAKFFRSRCKTLNMIVPIRAKSAATLMCLAADAIYLSEYAELGPIDVQVTEPLNRGAEPFSPLDESKSLEFLREYAIESLDYFTALLIRRSGMSIKEAIHESIPFVTAMMKPLYDKVDPLKFGEHRRLLAEGEEYAKRLLRLANNPNPKEVAERLLENYPVHDFFIDWREAYEDIELPTKILDEAQFELIAPMVLSAAEEEGGFYGFLPQKKPVAKTKRPPIKKRIAIVPNTSKGNTA